MSKNIPDTLLQWLLVNKQYNKADLFQIELQNGEVILASTAQVPMTIPVTNFPGLPPSLGFAVLAEDNFTRADENPLNPTNWTEIVGGFSPMQVVGDKCCPGIHGGNWFGAEYYTGVTLPENQFAEVTLGAYYAGGSQPDEIAVGVRLNLTTHLLYILGYGDASLPGQLFISNQLTAILGSAPYTPTPGDVLLIGAVGLHIFAQVNGVTVMDFIDTNPAPSPDGAGYIAIESFGTDTSTYFTDYKEGSVNGSATFSPTTQYGTWQRGSIQTEASYTPKSNSMSLTVSVDPNQLPQVIFPGTNTPLMETVAAGLFDAATVTVYSVFWGLGESPQTGINRGVVTAFVGQITKVSDLGRDKCDFEVADMLYQMNLSSPPNLVQSPCRHQLYDSGCTLAKTSFQLLNSVAAGSSTLQINLTDDVTTASFWNGIITFTQGYIIFTSGQNEGLTGYIKNTNTTTQILLSAPMPFPVATGDTFTMYAGCNKTLPMCNNGFSNLINFGGTPFVPNPELGL